jgi:hypothetical protein
MFKHKLVNWTGTMSLSDKHFRQTENFFLAAIADMAKLGLHNFNYGLLPSRSGSNIYNGIRVNEHVTGRIEVQLYNCNAITASGFRVYYDADEAGKALVKDYAPSEDKNIRNRDIRQWDIILSVDPFDRTPVGNPDPDEAPPRHPDAESAYALYVMPAGDINTMEFGRHHLTIGRVRKDGDRFSVDTQYIPPSTSMSAHPELSDYYHSFATMFSSIEKSSKTILEKIHERNNKSELALNVQAVCHDVLRYISRIYFDFRNRGRVAPPIETVNYISSMAHTVYIALSFLTSKQKEEMLKYFYEWTDFAPGAFDELLSSTLDIIYEHNDLRAMMVRSEHFLRTFSSLWERLARLEFIGQHKDNIIVSERGPEKKAGVVESWLVEA